MNTTRLKSVIDQLYKDAQTRRVFALSRSDAERLPALPHVAVISITAPDRPPATLEYFEHVIRLIFADVDNLSPDLSARAKTKLLKELWILSRAGTLDKGKSFYRSDASQSGRQEAILDVRLQFIKLNFKVRSPRPKARFQA